MNGFEQHTTDASRYLSQDGSSLCGGLALACRLEVFGILQHNRVNPSLVVQSFLRRRRFLTLLSGPKFLLRSGGSAVQAVRI